MGGLVLRWLVSGLGAQRTRALLHQRRRHVTSVPVPAGAPTFTPVRRAAFPASGHLDAARNYDVATDATRFLFVKNVTNVNRPAVVVANWFARFARGWKTLTCASPAVRSTAPSRRSSRGAAVYAVGDERADQLRRGRAVARQGCGRAQAAIPRTANREPAAPRLRQHLRHDLPVHVGQPEVAALEPVRQLRVVDAQQCRIVAFRSWTGTGSAPTL